MTFDAALSTSVTSHNKVADILKPGGLFLVDFPHRDTLSYQRARKQAASGILTEIEPNTFVDLSADIDNLGDAFLPHHYTNEAEVRDLLRSFDLLKLWAVLPSSPLGWMQEAIESGWHIRKITLILQPVCINISQQE